MDRIVKCTLTAMCMVYDGDKVLVQDKIDDEYTGIIFPGGHIENGESIVDGVIREVLEETGLTIENPQICGIKNWIDDDGSRYFVFMFKTDKFSGQLRSSDEGEMKWISRDELNDMDKSRLVEDFSSMFRMFNDESVSELFWEQVGNDYELRIK